MEHGDQTLPHALEELDLLVNQLKSVTGDLQVLLSPRAEIAKRLLWIVGLDQSLHFFQCESEVLASLDELHSLQVCLRVRTVPGRSPRRFAEQLSPLVETDCLDIDASLRRKLTDTHG